MFDFLPKVIHTYQNLVLDSTRWLRYRPRADDIVIATSYKSGTTWMQEIVRQLVFCGQNAPQRTEFPLGEVSPWLEARLDPLDAVIDKLDAQKHRRFIKTHLALDGVPYFPQVKYIVVGRDARDVAMSMWNHYSATTVESLEWMNNLPDRVGDPLAPAQDIHHFWRTWITRGWFAWEQEGFPFWGNLHHTKTWWEHHHRSNILFVHYNDLKHNLVEEVQRVARYLDILVADEELPTILQSLSLDTMRANEERVNSASYALWKEGTKSFFFKGTNGRWKDVLSAEELALYEEAAAKVLTPECRAWLEQGRSAIQLDTPTRARGT